MKNDSTWCRNKWWGSEILFTLSQDTVPSQWFWSCYLKVNRLHNVALTIIFLQNHFWHLWYNLKITLWESCSLTVWFCLQWRMTVTQVSTAIRRPIWRARPVRRIITTVPSATPRASAWPEGPTAVNPASGRPACMPAPRRARSLFLVWRTSAATLGPVFHPMGVAPSPPCSQWSGCPTSTSPLTSPQGLWCPDLAGSGATPLRSWATATTLPCTRAPWPTRLWVASAVLGLGSSRRQLAYRETSTSIHTAYHVHYRHTSTTLYIVSASCQSGTRTAKRAFYTQQIQILKETKKKGPKQGRV